MSDEVKTVSNLTLIGMPASGKSTCGQLLASQLGWTFIDLDWQMETAQKVPLWQIREQMTIDEFLEFEASFALKLQGTQQVISPGGSLVYSAQAMHHLRALGYVIGLLVDPGILLERIRDLKTRGVVIRPGQTFYDVAIERNALINKYAHQVFTIDQWTVEQTVDTIQQWLAAQNEI